MFNREQAIHAFEELASILASRGITGRVFVVGGAALALAFNARRAAREVASRLQLPDDWLNDAVKGFIPGTDPDAVPVFERPGLAVSAASAPFLLAMKLRAARVEQDTEDIRFLAALLGLNTPAAVLAVATQRYPKESLPPKTRFLVEELFGR